jgi:hypothetical protein
MIISEHQYKGEMHLRLNQTTGELDFLRIGRAVRVPGESLARWLADEMREAGLHGVRVHVSKAPLALAVIALESERELAADGSARRTPPRRRSDDRPGESAPARSRPCVTARISRDSPTRNRGAGAGDVTLAFGDAGPLSSIVQAGGSS